MARLKYKLLLILILSYTLGNAQEYKKLVRSGDRYFDRGRISDALKAYLKADKENPGNAKLNLKIGLSYMLGASKQKSLPYFVKVYKLNPKIDQDIEFYVASAYQYSHRYKDALRFYNAYKEKKIKQMSDLVERRIKECHVGDSLIKVPVNVLIRNMGPKVNSRFHDYSPLISSDGNTLILTSRREGSTGNLRAEDNGYFEDIYISYKNGDTWTVPQNISPNINFEYHDAAAALSYDGTQLFVYYEEGNGDIYVSNFDGKEWSRPQPLGRNINSYFWETSVSISRDGRKLFFSSDRPDGFGELDIYVSEKLENGTWGKAVNLGPNINTEGNDDSPYIHADGKTLYFSSDGHIGMGRTDIFKSELKNSVWQKPVNMGYPINSADDDGYFVISANSKKAYYASVKEDGVGNADIYEIEMDVKNMPKQTTVASAARKPQPKKEEPKKEEDTNTVVTLLKGKVLDATDAKPLGAKLTLVDNAKNVVVSEVDANPATGDFEIRIPHGGNYGLSTSRDGYLFNSINFNVPAFSEFRELDTHILLSRAEVGSKVVLKNIFFDTGKSTFRTESLSELERIKQLMIENPKLKVQINGHTDNVGNATYNKILSRKRAQAVVDYLLHHGVEPTRAEAKGYGEERPLVSNDDEQEGREINRRTEIEITEVGTT